jgi:hypothetical protein
MLLEFIAAEDDQPFRVVLLISTNFLPNDPVPPVTSTDCSDQFISCAS